MRAVNLDLIETLWAEKSFFRIIYWLLACLSTSVYLQIVIKFQHVKLLNTTTLTYCKSTLAVIYSDWHTSLSFSAHQTLLARDFTDNGNKALSFSIDNVIAIANEAIKMAIKVLILLPSSRIWPFVVPIFLHAPRQVLWDSLFVQDQRSVQQQAALTGCFGICWAFLLDHGEGERARGFCFLHRSVRGAHLWGHWGSLCGQNKRVTQGEKQQSTEWYFTLTHSLTYCQILHLLLFCCSLLADFDWLVLFCLLLIRLPPFQF